MDAKYGERYRHLFEEHWWWRVRSEIVLDTLRRHQPTGGWKTILDIGCGDGLFFDQLIEFGDVEGVEPCADLVNPDNVYCSRIHLVPFDSSFRPGKRYSLVLMLDVLEHLKDPAGALRHAVDLLEEDGTIVVTVPAFRVLWTNHDVLNRHFTRYTKGSFLALAKQTRLNIEETRYLYQWTCPVKLGLRVVERTFQLAPKPPSVPARWINESLYWLSRAEERSLGRLPVPFGSSLMVVGTNRRLA